MATDQRLNEIIKQLQEKVKVLKTLSDEMRSNSKKRTAEEIQSDLNAVLNEMSVLHEKAAELIRDKS